MIDENIRRELKNTIAQMGGASEGLTNTRISKAGYDKTLIGWVSEQIIPKNPKGDDDYKWRIQTNGVAYDIKPSACNITSVGQRVRLYIPNHNMKDKYAEVIENINDNALPLSATKISDNEVQFVYADRIVTWTADGKGNTRTNLAYSVESIGDGT